MFKNVKTRIFNLLLAFLILSIGFVIPKSAEASLTTITLSDLSTWTGANSVTDATGDINGGKYDLLKFWVTNDANNIYYRLDIKLDSHTNKFQTTSFEIGLQNPGVSGDNVKVRMFYDSGTIPTETFNLVSVNAAGTAVKTVTIPSSDVKILDTATSVAKTNSTMTDGQSVSFVVKIPFISITDATNGLGLSSFSNKAVYPVYAQTTSGPTLGSNVKDRVPDSNYLVYNAETASATITSDITAPTVGTLSGVTGKINTSNATTTSIDLAWAAATDDITTQNNLQYRVVYSTSNNITTLINAQNNGQVFNSGVNNGWATNITSSTVTGLAPGTLYYFNVIVKDEAGNQSVYSGSSGTTLANSVSITTQPSNATVNKGGNSSLSVTATGSGTLSYQWYSNATNSNSGGSSISGATNSSYTVPTTSGGKLYYYCIVTSTIGSNTNTATSNTAAVIVKPTITFDTNSDTTVSPSVVEYNTKVTEPTQPTDYGYTFVGWYSNPSLTGYAFDFNTLNTGDLALYGKWTKNSYTVSISATNGTVTGAQSYNFGDSVTVTATANSGYKFVSWTDNNTSKVVSKNATYTFEIANDTNLTANFAETAKSTVSYVSESGTIVYKTEKINSGVPVTLNPPSAQAKLGYLVTGWTDGINNYSLNNSVINNAVISTDTVLKPIYQQDPSAVTYSINVFNGESQSPTISTGKLNTSLTVTAASVLGKTFSCWRVGTKVVSYSSTYTFYISGNNSITAYYETVIKKPTINLDNAVVNTSLKKISFVSSYTIPSGYTLMEAGLVVKKSVSEPVLSIGTSGVTKAKSTVTAVPEGQYSMYLYNVPNGATWWAKAYLIYKDNTTGRIYTIYSSNVLSGTMN